jgi:choline-sulfatase
MMKHLYTRSNLVAWCMCVLALVVLGSCKSGEKGSGPTSNTVRPSRRLNVVVVTIDTLRPDRLGCYGYSKIETPNLDKFARRGVLFENAVAQAPLTAPSHASIFTGLYPTVHKVRDTGGFILASSHTTLASMLQRQGWDTAAFVGAAVLKKGFGFNQGFAVYDDEMPKVDPAKFAGEYPERRAGEVVNRAIGWLQSQSGKPFFLWVHVYDPHLPYDPPSPFREKYKGRPYDGEVAYTDQELGRLFDAVAKKSPAEDTIVAVLSDHGESLLEHGEYTHGVFLYDSTLRIAFMMAGPGVPAGLRVKPQARSIDFLPTVLELMGSKAPQGVQGTSLIPVFTGKQVPDSYSYEESMYPKINLGWAELRGIRTNRWKYVRAPKPELYDLVHDPGETSNVIGNHDAEVRELDAKLKAVTATSGSQGPEKAETSTLDQRTMEQLKSLGYTGGSSQGVYILNGKGADPKDRVGVLKLLTLAVTPDPGLPLPRRIAMLRQVAAEDPSNPAVYYHLGDILKKDGRPGEAIALYRQAISKGLRHPWLYSRMAYLYIQQGNKPDAIAAFEVAAKLDPSDYESLGDLAMAYLETGRAADAERVCHWILKITEEYAPAYNQLGIASYQKGDIARARVYFEKAIKLDPNLLEAQLNLGRIYKNMGANARARACFEAFLAKASQEEYGPLISKIRAELATMQ